MSESSWPTTDRTGARAALKHLLVVGYHGHRAIFGRIMGGSAQSIARLAPCPVLRAK
jgi:nucleotide-binding universal stress UspA family protein